MNDSGGYGVRSFWIAGYTLLGCLIASSGLAQSSATLNRFSAAETPEDDFHLSRPSALGDPGLGVQVHVDYANDPLVVEANLGDPSSEIARVVEHQLNGTLGISLGVLDRLVLSVGLPVVFVQRGDAVGDLAALGVQLAADGEGLADAYAGLRVRLAGEAQDAAALALQVVATFPSAGEQRLRGDEGVSLAPELLLELRPGPARMVLNVGGRIRKNASDPSSNMLFSDELSFGLGFGVPMFGKAVDRETHLDLVAQIYGSTQLEESFGRETTALEAVFGLKYQHASGVTLGAVAGPGLSRGLGSPDVRVVGQLGYRLPRKAPPPPEPVEPPAPPVVDSDGDGIMDPDDKCPAVPENVNGLEDDDGCPDEYGDQDGDGIRDNLDKCVDQSEDKDGFEDSDGCPEPDNDGDGVLDQADTCPLKPGPVENRGCPDRDRDGDSVVDRLDNCPDEPGTVENHGCRARQRVRLRAERLEILERVYFRTNRAAVRPRSFPLLRNVARVLNNHPEITRVRVEGHTDSRGRYEYNLDLSLRRAQAVVDFLTRRGSVDPSRLEIKGYGPDRPVIPGARTLSEHAQNRRVEFTIVETTAGVPQAKARPHSGIIE